MRNRASTGEPEYTIYGDSWDAARARVARLSSRRLRREHGALLDHMERGWAVLRPLQMEAENVMRWRQSDADAARVVADSVDVDVTHEFRNLAFDCREAVGGGERELAGHGLADEAEGVLRALRLLGMAASSPEFPQVLRECVVDAVEGFGVWLAGFRVVLAPLERGAAPVAVDRLRVVD